MTNYILFTNEFICTSSISFYPPGWVKDGQANTSRHHGGPCPRMHLQPSAMILHTLEFRRNVWTFSPGLVSDGLLFWILSDNGRAARWIKLRQLDRTTRRIDVSTYILPTAPDGWRLSGKETRIPFLAGRAKLFP